MDGGSDELPGEEIMPKMLGLERRLSELFLSEEYKEAAELQPEINRLRSEHQTTLLEDDSDPASRGVFDFLKRAKKAVKKEEKQEARNTENKTTDSYSDPVGDRMPTEEFISSMGSLNPQGSIRIPKRRGSRAPHGGSPSVGPEMNCDYKVTKHGGLAYFTRPHLQALAAESALENIIINAADVRPNWIQSAENGLWLPMTLGVNRVLELAEPVDQLSPTSDEKTSTPHVEAAPSHRETFHLLYVTSEPLIYYSQKDFAWRALDKLDLDEEKNSLCDALNESQHAIKVRDMVAIEKNLPLAFTHGCRAIHYSGHGMKRCLAFETVEGKMLELKSTHLEKFTVANAQGRQTNLKFVCVCACHSEDTANVFVQHGVPHVIAIRREVAIADDASLTFCRTLYIALLQGHTVSYSFHLAQSAVDWHAQGQANSFLLLPKDGDHDHPVFDDIPKGDWENLTPSPARKLLVHPRNIMGRAVTVQQVLQYMQDRVVVITGNRGIGKSAVACSVAEYAHKRAREYRLTGVFYFDMEDPSYAEKKSLGEICSLEMDKKCDSNDEFVRSIGDKKYLLIFDGVSKFLDQAGGSEFNVPGFLDKLNNRCRNVKMIVVSNTPLATYAGYIKPIGERVIDIPKLTAHDSAVMLVKRAPKGIQKADIRDIAQLEKHPIIKYLDGNPKKICEAVSYLEQYPKLNELLEFLQLVEIKSFEEFRSLCENRRNESTFSGKINNHLCSKMSKDAQESKHNIEIRKLSRSEMNVVLGKIYQGDYHKIWNLLEQLREILKQIQNLWCHKLTVVHGFMPRQMEEQWEAGLQRSDRPGEFFIRFKSSSAGLVIVVLLENRKIMRYPIGFKDGRFTFVVRDEYDKKETRYFSTLEELVTCANEARYLYLSAEKSVPKEHVFSKTPRK